MKPTFFNKSWKPAGPGSWNKAAYPMKLHLHMRCAHTVCFESGKHKGVTKTGINVIGLQSTRLPCLVDQMHSTHTQDCALVYAAHSLNSCSVIPSTALFVTSSAPDIPQLDQYIYQTCKNEKNGCSLSWCWLLTPPSLLACRVKNPSLTCCIALGLYPNCAGMGM